MISQIVERLGVEGMSGDETDAPSSILTKSVRCVEIPWLTPHISELFQAVDSYEPSVREENMHSHLGNTSLLQHYKLCKKNTQAKAISLLP